VNSFASSHAARAAWFSARLQFACWLATFAALTANAWAAATPIILDTDIGTDVDDAYALVLAATHRRLELKAVTTHYGDVQQRSAIARNLLLMLRRADVDVASGLTTALDGSKVFWGGWEGTGLLNLGEPVEGIAVQTAPQLLAHHLRASRRKTTIVSVGGLSNVAAAFEHDPGLRSRVARTERMRLRLERGPGTIRTVPDRRGPIRADVVRWVDVPRLSRLMTREP
jgi:hypothetical protein